MIEVTCKVCGEKFIDHPSRNRKYCSRECFHKDYNDNQKERWKNPQYREWRLKKLLDGLRRARAGKTYEEIYGLKRAKEIKDKLSESHRGYVHSTEQKKKISTSLKGHPFWGLTNHSHETRLKMSMSRKGRRLSEETKRKIGLASKKSVTELWKNPRYRDGQVRKIMKGWGNTPTKPENALIEIIQKYNLPFKYNGFKGDVIIGGKVPDFVTTIDDSMKVIEVFGRLFHDPTFPTNLSEIPYNKTYLGTIQHYKDNSYDCLIFWEDELKDEDSVIEEIQNFMVR